MFHALRLPSRLSLAFLGGSLLFVGLLTVACGGDDPTPGPGGAANTRALTVASATQTAPAMNTVEVRQSPLGAHLVDADGMTLYLFTNDERNVSKCSGGCTSAWPPLKADGPTMAGEGLDAELLATMQREDGSNQVTYEGRPLYHFANDQDPGDTLGQGSSGVWFMVSPDGDPVRTSVEVGTTVPADY